MVKGSACLLAAAVLSGCVIALPQRASQRAEVLSGSLRLAAPAGFCVDADSVQDGAESAFVLWGNCAAIAGSARAPRPEHDALLSATIGPLSDQPVEAAFDTYKAFFRSDMGRAALARSGQAEDVEVMSIEAAGSLLLLKISDRSASAKTPVAQVYWRAVTGLSGRVAALSVLPLAGKEMADSAQISLLREFEATIRAAN